MNARELCIAIEHRAGDGACREELASLRDTLYEMTETRDTALRRRANACVLHSRSLEHPKPEGFGRQRRKRVPVEARNLSPLQRDLRASNPAPPVYRSPAQQSAHRVLSAANLKIKQAAQRASDDWGADSHLARTAAKLRQEITTLVTAIRDGRTNHISPRRHERIFTLAKACGAEADIDRMLKQIGRTIEARSN